MRWEIHARLFNFRYWKHVKTPVFFTANQLSKKDFSERTCGITSSHEDYSDYTVGNYKAIHALSLFSGLIEQLIFN